MWHLQIVPRLATIAGFEVRSGMFVRTTAPEESAAVMRKVLSKDQAS